MSKTHDNLPAEPPGSGLPDAADLEGMTGAGLDNPRPEERSSSLLYLLQAGSKAVNPGAEQYIEGAVAGMFLSTDARRLYGGRVGVEFVPVWRELLYLEWVPIDDGGGFRGQHEPESQMVADVVRKAGSRFGKLDTGNGTELVQTNTVYALIGEPGFKPEDADTVAIPFTSIKIRHYNGWYKAARNIRYPVNGQVITPDIYRHRWRLSSEFEPKWKPNGAWNVRVALANGPDPSRSFISGRDPMCAFAREMMEGFAAGKHRADYSKAEDGGARSTDEEVPF